MAIRCGPLLLVVVIASTLTYCSAIIELEQGSFKLYRQEQSASQKNNIKLRFKTIHATGLIIFVQGSNKKDFMTIELVRGKIRTAANYGRGHENKLRPISGKYEMFLGKDLADNEWHSVEVVRNVRETIVFIDRGTKNEKHSFMKSPPSYNELSVSIVAFGGFYSFDPSEVPRYQSYARKGFKGCFSEASFSQTWPEDNDRKVDFMKDSYKGKDFIKVPQDAVMTKPECSPLDYKPYFFPSSAVHIAFREDYTIQHLKVELKFRTVISDQTLVNYTTKGNGENIQFRIDRKGRIVLSIYRYTPRIQNIETAKENYHDGEWHDVSFEIDNKETTESKLLVASLSTDNKKRYSTIGSKFEFKGYIHIGFGFTGCMRDIKVNDHEDFHEVQQDPNVQDNFFTVSEIGVVPNLCRLKDYCSPNPCRNGGKCNQTDDNVVCDCRDTFYEGSTCHRNRFNYTCSGVRKSGERRSDVYYIDFDGMGPMEPVKAVCDLGRTVETTTTQINNTKYLDLDVTARSGKNTMAINYAANIIQMRELIKNSVFCEQYIKFTCKGAPLFRSPAGPPATSWMGGDDLLHYYWGGAKNNRGYCACGVKETCRNKNKYCNCDDLEAFQNVWDEGNFTKKEHLPVREVHFTQVLRARGVQAILRVGHLRCTGFGSRLNAATFRKEWSYLSVRHADQPFDRIRAGGVSFEFKTAKAYNYMVVIHAHGPFSGDYLKVLIRTRTLMRIHFNTGFGDIKQDIDLAGTGRTLDDNDWHEFSVMFNMKELNVTLNGVHMIQGLPLQEEPFEFNVDDKPLYVGGSLHGRHGFVGCIRSLYVNGRIHDLRSIARGMEDYGVYPGCGSACMLIPNACNFGFCIEKYDSFKCNCSVSPNDGKYCGNETNPKRFTGSQFATYDLQTANHTEPVAEAIITVGFKTTQSDSALAQVEGSYGRHFSIALMAGYLTLLYNTKLKNESRNLTGIKDTETGILRITKRKLDNDKHNIVRVRFSTEEIFLTSVNHNLEVGENFTERYIDPNNTNKGLVTDVFGPIKKFTVGTILDERRLIDAKGFDLPTTYTGCMSGAKLVYSPRATSKKRFRQSIEVDMFRLMEQNSAGNGSTPNPSGTFPDRNEGLCGPTYPLPGKMPPVGPPRQFYTTSPGLDNSVTVTAIDSLNISIMMLVVFIVALVLLGFLYLIYRKVSVINKNYNNEKRIAKGTGKSDLQTTHQLKPATTEL